MIENLDFGAMGEGENELAGGHTGNRVEQIIFQADRLKLLYILAKDAVGKLVGHEYLPLPISYLAGPPGLMEVVNKYFPEANHNHVHPIRVVESTVISGLVHVHHEYEDGFRIQMLDTHILIPE